MLDVLDAAHTMMGDAKIVTVNEPIYISSGSNSEVRYNKLYPRWAYDRYREFMQGWMAENQYPYLDMWNVIPQEEFSDFPVHLYPAGEQLLAESLAPEVLKFSCP